MSPQEAKEVLSLYRPGTADVEDPLVAEALELARRDPALRDWLHHFSAGQTEIRSKLRQLQAPPEFRQRLLRLASTHAPPTPEPTVLQPRIWWRSPWTVAAAALVALLLLVSSLWQRTPETRHFANFKSRMIGTVLREYRMDVETNDMRQVRQFMATRGSPADYELSSGLDQLEVAGGGFLRWKNEPVSMVCMRRGDKQMVYLFVLRRSALPDPPPAQPIVENLKGLKASSWTTGENSYVLLTPQSGASSGK